MDKSATSHFVAAENPAALCNKIVQREQEQPETAAKVRKQRNNHTSLVNFFSLSSYPSGFNLGHRQLFSVGKYSRRFRAHETFQES